MTANADSDAKSPRPGASRMHVDGKLSFRRRVPVIDNDDLPLVFAGETPPDLPDLVPGDVGKIEIEVGPGKGAFLAAAAAEQPDRFFVGIEAAPAYAKHSAERIDKAELTNALLLVDNGKVYLKEQVPEGSLHKLHVYYPDPWPKRRHRKRRFFTQEMPAAIHRALAEDGWLYVATDNAGLAGEIARVLGSSDLLIRDRDEELRLRAGPLGVAFSPTSFERKYIEEGRILRRYAFRPR